MTTCTRRVRRITNAMAVSRGRGKPICITLEPGGHTVSFRLAGERKSFSLPTQFLYVEAVRQAVIAKKAAKLAARKARKAGRA